MRVRPSALELFGGWSTPAVAALALASCAAEVAAQPSPPGGKELYEDRLGCWNCHGRTGEGGEGRPLRNTRLPLSRFVKQLRLPSGMMPPYASFLVSDAELAVVYRWLQGIEAVGDPPTVHFTLEGFESLRADVESDVQFTARTVRTMEGIRQVRVRYRITLLGRDDKPVGDRPLAQRDAHEVWSGLSTDEDGQAMLGPPGGMLLADPQVSGGDKTWLRLALPAGHYVFVVEALDAAAPAGHRIVLGVGSAVLQVE